jgi:hypothetical protein
MASLTDAGAAPEVLAEQQRLGLLEQAVATKARRWRRLRGFCFQ